MQSPLRAADNEKKGAVQWYGSFCMESGVDQIMNFTPKKYMRGMTGP